MGACVYVHRDLPVYVALRWEPEAHHYAALTGICAAATIAGWRSGPVMVPLCRGLALMAAVALVASFLMSFGEEGAAPGPLACRVFDTSSLRRRGTVAVHIRNGAPVIRTMRDVTGYRLWTDRRRQR